MREWVGWMRNGCNGCKRTPSGCKGWLLPTDKSGYGPRNGEARVFHLCDRELMGYATHLRRQWKGMLEIKD